MKRRDLLAECIQPGTPIDVLTNQWCARCLNPECSRSAVGKSRFDQRVLDWEEKLFKNPPKLAPEDPRFAGIVAHKFITIDPGRTPEIRSEWVDPRDLKEPEPAPLHAAPSQIATPTRVPEVVPDSPPTAEARTPSPPNDAGSKESARPTEPKRSGAALALVGANAPDQTGKLLRGSPTSPNTVADPWAAPDPPDPADQVVQPGATIKMGQRSGV